jgi:Flp pilus assembly protein TadG
MMRKLRERIGERGSAAVELAMSLPVLLTVTAGVIEFGQAFQLRHNLVQAATEAARAGSALTCPRPTESEARDAAGTALESAGLEPSLARISLTNTGGAPGSEMNVVVAYDAHLPMLGRFLHLRNIGSDGSFEVSVEIAAENE